MSQPAKRRLRLAAGVPGVNHWTVWGAPGAGSQIDFSTFEHVARTAERGFFDYFFLAEGLRVREHKGRLHELDVAGRPDNFSVLAAVAAVTEHIGLVGTASATFNEPYDLARRIASLDHLSGGRAGWNIVTSSDAFTGANFRRGGYLDYPDRYRRAAEFVELSRALWDSWDADGPQHYRFDGEFFDTEGWFPVAPGPQGHPVLVQAGDSGDGRDFAVTTADVVFSRHGEPEAGRAFRSDIRARALAAGRDPDGILVIPAVSIVLGDTPAEAEARARETQFTQVTPQTAIHLLEQIWGVDLSAHDPEGPVPTPPDSLGDQLTHGQARRVDDPLAAAHAWHAEAVERDWSIRELVVAKTTRHEFIGTPSQIAERLDDAAQTGAADGYVLSGSVVPHGIDEFVDKVVPLLQERGVLRTSYEHPTLRENLGLGDRPWVREGALARAELAS